jgi:8-oxo-dGTP pyrophosphatase MutT (NUDIX family)
MNDPHRAAPHRALEGLDGREREDPPPDPEAMEATAATAVTEAAVSLILREGSEPALLLIKRAERETDPWSGHMALPGGRREVVDSSLVETAMRETREETGVDLARTGRPVGRLPVVAPTNRRLPRIAIHPFMFTVPVGTPARVASDEVDAVHWVPLSELRDPACESTVAIALSDGDRDFPCLRVRGEVVWGLTYRILTTYFERLPAAV